MRKVILGLTLLLAIGLSPPPASGFWFHHRPHHVPVVVGAPAGIQSQGLWSNLAGALIPMIPGLLNQLHVQFPGGRQPGFPGQPGSDIFAAPVPEDVAKTLNALPSKLDDILTRSRNLLSPDIAGKALTPSVPPGGLHLAPR